jgi:hypothetical protein
MLHKKISLLSGIVNHLLQKLNMLVVSGGCISLFLQTIFFKKFLTY